MPALPKLPVRDDSTTLKYKAWLDDQAHYLTSRFWNNEAIACIKKRFVGSLIGKEIGPNLLPESLTASDAIAYIIQNVKTAAKSQKGYAVLSRELLDLKYVPNALGAVDYFKHAKEIQANIADLAIPNTVVSDTHVMTLAETAFMISGHDANNVSRINEDWKATGAADFENFQAHYNKRLKELWDNGDHGREMANHTERLELQIR